ncbi:MAG TPA: acyl-CoA dehydrogenase, partial [Planctomycetota bacterium]|nr:acyl-CoA dehydrogenase [Planctomycetota bacterium]
MTFLALVLLSVLLFLVLGYLGKPGVGAVLAATLFLVGFWQICGTPPALWILTGLALLGTLVGSLPPLRRALITGRVMGLLAPSLPKISETELVALEAGTVWWD